TPPSFSVAHPRLLPLSPYPCLFRHFPPHQRLGPVLVGLAGVLAPTLVLHRTRCKAAFEPACRVRNRARLLGQVESWVEHVPPCKWSCSTCTDSISSLGQRPLDLAIEVIMPRLQHGTPMGVPSTPATSKVRNAA